jgi:hypothetical protein
MNIHELDSYDLGDAVKFNDKLNPRIWGADEKMRPEVREQLLRIADDFREFLGIDVEVKDITVSGSNAAYTYTPHSDIDLHLVVDLPNADSNEVYRELFDAKKYAYNDQHNIKIGGYDVELYVQDANKSHISQGIYSVKNDDWVSVPKRRKPDVNDISVQSKFEDLGNRIEAAIASGDYEKILAMANKVKEYRQAGLDAHGEFGPENLAFKILRTQGLIKKLYDARNEAKDQLLSLDERQKKKKRKAVKYGYGGYWYPGTSYAGQDHPAGSEGGGGDGGGESVREGLDEEGSTPDGVNPSTTMVLSDVDRTPNDEEILQNFIDFVVKELKIESMPRVKLRKDPQWPAMHKTFGRYNDDAKTLEVAWGQRHIMDVLRTVAHELTHKHQHEREGERMGPDAGETGSPYENEANARAGVLMRDYGRLHPEYFDAGQVQDLEEGASGYIPTRAQAKDPRYSMALTVDIKPGQVGKEANKLKLKTNKQGAPQIARANGLFEELMLEFQLTKEDIDTPISKTKDEEQYYKFIVSKAKLGRPLTRGEQDYVKMYQMYRQQKLAEFAPTPDRDDNDDVPDQLLVLANRWWNATDRQPQIEHVLNSLGWSIHQVESEDDAVQLQHRDGTTYFISADEFDPDLFEISDKLRQSYLGRAGQQVDRRQERMAAVRDRLNKGYEIYHADRPAGSSQIVDRFDADTPALARQYYEKFIQDYVSDVDFDLRLRRSTGIMEDVELDEVNMSPGALEKFAASKEAQGIRAGFEAELIFRDTQGDDEDDQDMEPDYDMDERAYSIQQVIEFFSNDDWGYGLSARQIRSLEDELDETYMNWRDEQMMEDFKNEAEDLIREVWLEERPMGERVLAYLTDALDMTDEEAERILRLGTDAPRFNSTSEQEGYAAENPDYETYLEAVEAAEAILDEEVEASIDNQDGYYDQALDNFRDNYSGDDDSFFSDVGMRWMSDVANNFGLDWPYMTGGGNSNNGSRSWDEIGDELSAVVGMPVKVSSNYHSTPRKEGQWIIEPDGSLDPDDKSEEAGLEIVSPPMPLLMAIAKLKEVVDWANNPNGGNAYTNSSTGLHMGVSLPTRGGDVDYVKLILFMGDKYVLDTFGREANSFTASALGKLQQNIKGGKSDPAGVIKLLKHGLTELAYKELQKGVGTSKYTSAHLQNGYIEFRSPGGDWLAKADEEIGVLENTMMRFARAMQIAGDPSAERAEYAKKLYKLVTSDNDQYADQLRLFSEFSAGTIDQEQLKKRWAEKTIGKQKEINQRWKLYQKVNGTWTPVPAAEWNGYTEDQVKNAVWSKYGREALDSGEYQLVNMGEQDWEVYDVKTGKTLEVVKGKSKGEVADAVYDKYVDQGIGFQVRPYEDPAKLTPRAKLAKRIATKKPEPKQVVNQATNERGVPYWEVYEINNDWNVIHTFLSDTAADAKVDGANWLTSIGAEQPELFAVRAKMIPNPQTTDNKKDSVDLQRRLGVQDVDTDIAQNFNQPQDATDIPRNWEFVDRITGRVVHNMSNASYNQANVVQDNLESRYPDADIYLRSVSPRPELSEAIDPISGAGAVFPRQDPKSIGKKSVTPAEKVFKNPVKDQPYRSAIGQAIGKKDLENMTQQIQVARKLGDSVMEMEDTPPEVVKALDQAAQKNGYRNWADVKANPRSPQAVMTVAKLASTILRTTGTHHEKLFYKNKTDVDENFADGKVKGKSRPGRVKRSGASCNGSVTDLRRKAKNASGEKAKMYHWCANMKSGKKK